MMKYEFWLAFTALVAGIALCSGALTHAQSSSSSSAQIALPPNIEILDPGPTKPFRTLRGNIRGCPDGFAVSGIHGGDNVLLCMRMLRPGYQLSTVATPSVGNTAASLYGPTTQPAVGHTGTPFPWCGPNRFMVGIDLQNNPNTLLCSTWSGSPPVSGGLRLRLDKPPAHTVRNNLHACPQGWALVGADINQNIFLCGEAVPATAPPPPPPPPPPVTVERPFATPAGSTEVVRSEPNYHTCDALQMRVLYGDSAAHINLAKGQNKAMMISMGTPVRTTAPSNNENPRGTVTNWRTIGWECRNPGSVVPKKLYCPGDANLVKISRSANSSNIYMDCVIRRP